MQNVLVLYDIVLLLLFSIFIQSLRPFLFIYIFFCTKYIHWYFSLIVNWFLTINWYLSYFLEIRYRIKRLVMLIYSETVTSLSLNLIFLLLLILLIFQVDKTNFKLFFPVDFAAFFFSLYARFSSIFSEMIFFSWNIFRFCRTWYM